MSNNTETEIIGGVKLNYKYYSGEDLYSDGPIEDTLLDIVSNYSDNDFDHVIQNTKSWPIMYHLSHERENIVSWLPIARSSKILEIGAGCGAITGTLARMSKQVTCIELSKKRSLINATKNREYDNIEIMVGNYEDVEKDLTEKYDYITLIGVFEYAELYISSNDSYHDFLNSVKKHLAPGGKIIIAIENKFGLKYFAGCKEDHTGRYFEGLEGYRESFGVKTFSKKVLENIIDDCGLVSKFYYPYPDYKLPHTIYSDEHLPKKGELNTNLRNYDNDRVVLFDESKVFDSLIEEELFQFYSNSFLVIVTENEIPKDKQRVIFAKYSNQRKIDSRITTILSKISDDEPQVFKRALNHYTNKHIQNLITNYEKLSASFEGSKFIANKVYYIKGREPVPLIAGATSKAIDVARFEYVKGVSLEKYLDDLCEAGEYDEITRIIHEYEKAIYSLSDGEKFRVTEKFKKIFSESPTGSYYGKAYSNFDAIFSNICLCDNNDINGKWTVLDYEWVFDFSIPDKFIIFRALYYQFYKKNHAYANHLETIGSSLNKEFDISEYEWTMFTHMEAAFQSYVIGGVASLEVMHSLMPTNTVFLDSLLRESNALKNLGNPKIYYSYGEGFSDERQIYIIPKLYATRVQMDIPLESNMRGLRIDPTEYPCIVNVLNLSVVYADGREEDITRFVINGYSINEKTVLFDTDDAQIILEDLTSDMRIVKISYTVSMFLPEVYEAVKSMAMENQKNRTETNESISNKVLMKLGFMERPEVLPEGYSYNYYKK